VHSFGEENHDDCKEIRGFDLLAKSTNINKGNLYLHPGNDEFKRDYGLKDQIQRSCVSVMSNIAEGFGRSGNSEFMQFLYIAKGSLSEVRSQLYVASDLGYITNQDFKKAFDMTEEIYRLINAFVKSIKNSGNTSLKKK
jgi:four helix bundle protein